MKVFDNISTKSDILFVIPIFCMVLCLPVAEKEKKTETKKVFKLIGASHPKNRNYKKLIPRNIDPVFERM